MRGVAKSYSDDLEGDFRVFLRSGVATGYPSAKVRVSDQTSTEHTRGDEMTTMTRRPTLADANGRYELVIDGIWWGRFVVNTNWAGERYVSRADADWMPTGEAVDLDN